jgi:hypothetical protein
MGSRAFSILSIGSTPDEAFHLAKAKALECHPSAGYTGSIAEKSSFILFQSAESMGMSLSRWIESIIENHDSVKDEWGDAGCIDLGAYTNGRSFSDNKYIFFGVASE